MKQKQKSTFVSISKDARLGQGGNTSAVVAGSDVASALLDMMECQAEDTSDSNRRCCDVMVLTTHGHGALPCWLTGTTAERVLSATTAPVFLVPTRGKL